MPRDGTRKQFGKHITLFLAQADILYIWNAECNILKKHFSQVSWCVWRVRLWMEGTKKEMEGEK